MSAVDDSDFWSVDDSDVQEKNYLKKHDILSLEFFVLKNPEGFIKHYKRLRKKVNQGDLSEREFLVDLHSAFRRFCSIDHNCQEPNIDKFCELFFKQSDEHDIHDQFKQYLKESSLNKYLRCISCFEHPDRFRLPCYCPHKYNLYERAFLPFYEKRMVNVFEEIKAEPKNFRIKINDLWDEWENFSHEERNMWM